MRWALALGVLALSGCGDSGGQPGGDSGRESEREAFIRERCENAAGSEQGFAYCSENAGKLWDRNNP